MIASGMIGMIRTYMIACHHLCPYHAYHAACDHAYPVLRSVLCTPSALGNQVLCTKFHKYKSACIIDPCQGI